MPGPVIPRPTGLPVARWMRRSSRATACGMSTSCFVSPRTTAPIATAASTSRRASTARTASGISQVPGTRTTATTFARSAFAFDRATATIRSGSGALNSLATRTMFTEVHPDRPRVREALALARPRHRGELVGLEQEPPSVHCVLARPRLAQRCEFLLLARLRLLHEDPKDRGG